MDSEVDKGEIETLKLLLSGPHAETMLSFAFWRSISSLSIPGSDPGYLHGVFPKQCRLPGTFAGATTGILWKQYPS